MTSITKGIVLVQHASTRELVAWETTIDITTILQICAKHGWNENEVMIVPSVLYVEENYYEIIEGVGHPTLHIKHAKGKGFCDGLCSQSYICVNNYECDEERFSLNADNINAVRAAHIKLLFK